MYIETEAENYTNLGQEILRRLHQDNRHENIVLNTKFKQCYFPAHEENLSLKFAFEGNEVYEYGARKVEVSPSNFLLINEGQKHASWIESESWVNSFAIYFTPEFAASVVDGLLVKEERLLDDPFRIFNEAGSLNFFQNLFPFSPYFISEVGLFKKYLEETGGRETLLIDEKLTSIFLKVVSQHQTDLSLEVKRLDAIKLSTRIEILRRLRIARDTIESFFTTPISISDISKACYLSENLLLRYFKMVYATSPHQYLVNKRLEYAKMQLMSTNLTFNEITYASGFECPSSFGRLFKQRFGMTPNGMRETVRM